jgi:hypothetical protein
MANSGNIKIAITLFIIAALFPTIVGFTFFIDTVGLYGNPESHVMLRQYKHIVGVNLMGTGISSLVMAIYGIPKRIKWCWLLGFFNTFWVGLNDTLAVALTPGNTLPLPLIPTTIAAFGLALSYSFVFDSRNSTVEK